jgi:hypothetical protein
MCLSLGEIIAGVRDAAPQSSGATDFGLTKGWGCISCWSPAMTRPLTPPAVSTSSQD